MAIKREADLTDDEHPLNIINSNNVNTSNSSDEDHKTPKKPRKRAEKKIWRCKKCEEFFPARKHLQEHRKIYHQDTVEFISSYKHDEENDIYICNYCDAECSSKEEIEIHAKVHVVTYVCNVCYEEYLDPYKYACHLYTHSDDKIFRCVLCSHKTHLRTSLLAHVNNMHLQKFPYSCKYCGKGFNDHTLFKEHNDFHEGGKLFTCVVCDKGFMYSRYLLEHQKRYHKVSIEGIILPNQCPVCKRIFAKDGTLEKHIEKHSTDFNKPPYEKKHLCDICGKGFARKDKLQSHYRVHTGVKPYACSYCPKSFTKKDYLVMHERIHSGEKPYSCEYCGKCFNQGAPLKVHVRSHTGERPYVCHICRAGFMSKGALNSHFKSCSGFPGS